MIKRKRIVIGVVVLCVLAVLAIPAYQPLKFHYAIWRIESAKTVEQERTACVLAGRVGRVWEVDEIHSNEFCVLPARIRPGTNDVVVRIEWFEGPWWQGIGGMANPYRAYRVFLDPKSREFLFSGKSN